MYSFSPENIPKTYTRLPWDSGDRSKYDYGNPPKYSTPVPKSDELETALEWQRMHDEDSLLNDLIEPIY